jgi:hypothetical protein
VNDFIRNGKTPEDGIKVILYTDRKWLKGQYTFQNGIYVWGKYSEATLVSWLSSKTIQAEVGKKWGDIDLGGGWNGTAFVEWSLSQTKLRYGSEKSDQKSNILQMQAGLRWEKTLAPGSTIYAGVGTNIISQTSKPTIWEYSTLGPLGTWVSAESGLSMVAGANIQASPHTKFSGEIGIDTQKWPNVQGLSTKDLNPLWKWYHTTSVRLWAETSIGSGSWFGSLELKKWPLTQERTIGAGYRTDSLSATIEQTTVQPTHTFWASADNLVRMNIEKNFWKGVTGFFWVEKWKIAWTKTQIWAKLEF